MSCASASSGFSRIEAMRCVSLPFAPVERPAALVEAPARWLREHDGLRHLAHEPVAQDDHHDAVLVGEVECLHREVRELLNGARGEHDAVIVPVPAALDRLEVVPLRPGDVAEARAAAHHVDDHRGKLGARKVGDALHLEADARRGGGGHDARAGGRGAENHVDRRDLALRLEKGPSDLGQAQRHVGGKLVLRRDGIAEVDTGSRR